MSVIVASVDPAAGARVPGERERREHGEPEHGIDAVRRAVGGALPVRASAGRTSSSRPARTSHDCPNLVSMTSPIAFVSHRPAMSWPVVYAACMPDAEERRDERDDPAHPQEPAHTGGRSRTSGEHQRRNTIAPTRTRTDPNASARVSPNAIPTPRSRLVVEQPGDVARRRRSLRRPSNVKAPVIGCESAETTLPVDDVSAVGEVGERRNDDRVLVAVLARRRLPAPVRRCSRAAVSSRPTPARPR